MLAKNNHLQLLIDDFGASGEGVGRANGFTLFVEGGVPGDLLEVRVLKLKKQYGYGKIVRVINASPLRTEPVCSIFGRCGGCNLQHVKYEAQLAYKKSKIENCLKKIGGFTKAAVEEIISAEEPFFYRNKGLFPVGFVNGKAVAGLFAARSHRVIPCEKCYIQHPINDEILKIICDFLNEKKISVYDESTHTGIIRHIMTRVAPHTQEVMVCLVINSQTLPHAQELVARLTKIKQITSIMLNINTEKTNVALGTESKLLWGNSTIMGELCSLKFEISPSSFLQVNTRQTEKLYKLVADMALSENKNPTVLDIYCGIGTISLYMARRGANYVVGVESVTQAIEDAKRNALINKIKNVEFFAGKAEEVIPKLYHQQGFKVDVVVLDPPRKGCDEALLKSILKIQPKRIIYVSCDPATLARDLKQLCVDGYALKRIVGVDCFCMTPHIETVCSLEFSQN